MFWFGNRKHRKSKKTRRLERAKTSLLSTRRTFVEHLEQRALLTMLPPATYPVGPSPTSVQTGDFNGDGRLDILALYSSASQATVMLGNANGTFQAPLNSVTEPFTHQLAMGDFNHDGKLDIADNDTTSVGIQYGNGDGTFQPPVIYPIGASANDIEAGDYNHDGYDDIDTASFSYGGTSQLLMNDGTGNLLPPRNFAIGIYGREVHSVDVNGDGNEDLVQSNSSSTIGVMLGNGDGTFQGMVNDSTGIVPTDIAFGDFNKDGHLDAAVTNGTTLGILLGNGTGGFQAGTSDPINTSSHLQVADLNGDGNLDVLTNSGDVAYGRGDGTFYAPVAMPGLAGTTAAVGDFNGDLSPDVVTSTTGGVSVSLNAHNDAAVLAGAVGLVVNVPNSVTAGTPFAVTVSAVDASGNIVPGFLGTVGVTSIPGKAPVSYTFGAADGGTHTIAGGALLFAAGPQTITVTSPFLPNASATVLVNAAAASKLSVSAPSTSAAGQPASVTVTALDPYGNVAQSYTGTMHFTSSDAQAVLPADYTFTAADAGVHTFAASLKTAGAQTIGAGDLAAPTIAGTSAAVTVTPGAASSLSLTGGGGFIGSPHAVSITARDAYGNIATCYGGVVHLASSDANSTVSADAALVNGVGTFTVTPMTIGSQTLTASDTVNGTIAGTETIQVTAGWATRFIVSPLSATVAGQTQMMTVTAYDAFGDISNVYTGTIVVSNAGRTVGYYTFTAADQGSHAIPVTLTVAGSQTVTVYDLANPAVNFTQTGILVSPAAAASLSVGALHGVVAGTAQNLTVTARDAYGNIATGYLGTIALSTGDAQAVFPATYTFTAADAGVHTFSVTFKTAGGQTFGVVDTANSTNLAFTSSQRDIPITPAAAAAISIRAQSNVTAGVAFNITVSIVDAYGNVVPSYRGTIHFTGPSGGGNLLPADYTYTAADNGSHTFSVTFVSTGTQTIGAQDTVNGALKGQTSVKVVTSTTSTGGGGGGATGGGGGTGGGGTGGGGGGGKLTGA